VTNNLCWIFVWAEQDRFPLSYQAGVTPTTLNVQDIANSTETGAAPYQFANPAWVLK